MRQQNNGGNVFFYSQRNKGKLKVYTRKWCGMFSKTMKRKTNMERKRQDQRAASRTLSQAKFATIRRCVFCFLRFQPENFNRQQWFPTQIYVQLQFSSTPTPLTFVPSNFIDFVQWQRVPSLVKAFPLIRQSLALVFRSIAARTKHIPQLGAALPETGANLSPELARIISQHNI